MESKKMFFILGLKVMNNLYFCYKPQIATAEIVNESVSRWKNSSVKDSFGLKIIRALVEAENPKKAKQIFRDKMALEGKKVSFINMSKLWFCRQYLGENGWVSEEPAPVQSHEALMSFIFQHPGFTDFVFACRAVEKDNERLLLINAKSLKTARTNAENSLRSRISRDLYGTAE